MTAADSALGRAWVAINADSVSFARKRELADRVVNEYPQSSDAYFYRAVLTGCHAESHDVASALRDIDSAAVRLVTAGKAHQVLSLADIYSLRGTIDCAEKDYARALNDLERAIRAVPAKAADVFNTGDVEPKARAPRCSWSSQDLDTLIARFPRDYRAYLCRGLYYAKFAQLKKQYTPRALADIAKATVLNPRSALAFYLLGTITASRVGLFTQVPDAQVRVIRQQALEAYAVAVALDPRFADAYALRANIYYEQKQPSLAVKEFDKALAIRPDGANFNDRGMTKSYLGDYLGAIEDFTRAIEADGEWGEYSYLSYEERARANAALGNFDQAVNDQTEAIKRQLASTMYTATIAQVRKVYPEYGSISDEELCHHLHRMFFSDLPYEAVAEQMLGREKSLSCFDSIWLSDMFATRADYYLGAMKLRLALVEYQRVLTGFPQAAKRAERWKSIGSFGGEAVYIDSQSADLSDPQHATVWIKIVASSPTSKKKETVQQVKVDGRGRTLVSLAWTEYSANGRVLGSGAGNVVPEAVTPGSLGEVLVSGLCW